jgi:hypothetical protein
MEEAKDKCRMLVENPAEKQPLGVQRRSWEGNIRICPREVLVRK